MELPDLPFMFLEGKCDQLNCLCCVFSYIVLIFESVVYFGRRRFVTPTCTVHCRLILKLVCLLALIHEQLG